MVKTSIKENGMAWPIDLFLPDLICEKVTDIPFEEFEKKGIRVVVFDIDNTLVSYETPDPTEQVLSFLKSFEKRGIQVALVSNNSPQRVERFNAPLGFFTVPDSHKPLKRALRPVFRHFSVTPDKVLLVGDQLLTDVLCARRSKTAAVVVRPIKKKENLFFRIKRMIEKPLIAAYYRRKRKEPVK
jgi:HAD superfamily phosphatase (TIGR01668 family)